ncbi:MAG: lipopolysaccharide biosynthesis protein [Gammaproteobacteria bacterium]
MILREKVLQSGVFLTMTRWIQQAVRAASYIILARLLDPNDYGIATLAQVPIGLLGVAAAAGMGPVLVSTRAEIEKAAPHGLLLALTGATTLTAVSLVFAPFYADALGRPELTDVCRALAIMILCDGLYPIPKALLSRTMSFRWVAIADTVSTICGIGIAIVLAYLGFGYWSLVWSSVGTSASRLSIVVWKSPMHQWLRIVPWDRELAYQLSRYGLSATGTHLLYYTHTKGDYLVTGKLFGPEILGNYTQGFRIANLPGELFHSTLDHALLPAYTQLRDDKERLARVFLSSCRMLALVLFPTAIGMFCLAPELVVVLVGEKWSDSISFLQIFAFQGLVRAAYDIFIVLFNSVEKPHYGFQSTLVAISVMALGIIISIVLKLPPEGVALSVLGGYVAGLIFDVGLLRYRMTLPLPALDFVVQTLPIALTSGVMFLFVSGVKQVALTHGIATATLPMLAALIISGVLSYAGALFVTKPSLVGEALDVVRVALGRERLFQGLNSRRAIAATLLQVFRRP